MTPAEERPVCRCGAPLPCVSPRWVSRYGPVCVDCARAIQRDDDEWDSALPPWLGIGLAVVLGGCIVIVVWAAIVVMRAVGA